MSRSRTARSPRSAGSTTAPAQAIDADGLVVAPGFIDPHTHYDAQICWDPAISPSSWHGVTSVVMGNCGVGIAPCRPEAREIAMRDLVNVEGIPFEVLERGITWDWETFPEFLDAAGARGSALNLAFLAPLTPFRHWVMGEASMERAATAGRDREDRGADAARRSMPARSASRRRAEPAHGLPGAAAGLPQRQPRGAEGLLPTCCKERGKGAIEIALTQKISACSSDEEGSCSTSCSPRAAGR